MTEKSPKEVLLERLRKRSEGVKTRNVPASYEEGFKDAISIAQETVKLWFDDYGLTFQLKLDNTPAKRSLSEVEARAEQLRDALDALGIQTLPLQREPVAHPGDRYKGSSDREVKTELHGGGENMASKKEQPLWCKKCGEPVGVYKQGDAIVLGCKQHRTQIASFRELADRLKVDWVGQDQFEEELE